MKKTLTMAAVAATFAGMAVATIETTNVGGYLEKSGDKSLVCNPFNGTGTIADIGGLGSGDSGTTVYLVSDTGTATAYEWDGSKWINATTRADASATTLARGQGFQLSGNKTVAVSGVVTEGNVQASVVKGNNFYGNAAPVAKSLANLTIANFNADRGDYVRVGSSKYVISGGKWYERSNYLSADNPTEVSVSLAAGEGIVIYRKLAASTTATLPGSL
jgi:hypothetical protein